MATKEQKSKWDKRYRETHKEILALKNKIWREKNKERISIRHKLYVQRNKEHFKKYKHEYYMKHRDEILKKIVKYHKEHPEVTRKSCNNYYARNRDSCIKMTMNWAKRNPQRALINHANSLESQASILKMDTKSYKWALNAWSKVVKERDNYSCSTCGSKDKLHAHHVLAKAENPMFALLPMNGITLCHDCHWNMHRSEKL